MANVFKVAYHQLVDKQLDCINTFTKNSVPCISRMYSGDWRSEWVFKCYRLTGNYYVIHNVFRLENRRKFVFAWNWGYHDAEPQFMTSKEETQFSENLESLFWSAEFRFKKEVYLCHICLILSWISSMWL